MGKTLGEVTSEHLHGTQYSDYFYIDSIFGYPGIHYWTKRLYTYAGDDFVVFNPASVSTTYVTDELLFDGGSGDDWFSLGFVDDDIVLDLGQNYGRIERPDYVFWDHGIGGWRVVPQDIRFDIYGFENVTGGKGNDKIRGDDWDNAINGMNGADTLYGHGGEDTISGGNGDDSIYGGNDRDTLAGNDGDDRMWGDAGNDYMGGGDGEDTLEGGSGSDTILGGDDDDVISGDGGDDRLEGDAGNDSIWGGSGFDRAIYDTNGDVSVFLWNEMANGALGHDKLYSIEAVETGGGDDLVQGTMGDNLFWLAGGDDYGTGYEGNDSMWGGDGNDTLSGGDDDDLLYGGAHNDSVKGGEGDDLLYGNEGNDTIEGSYGDDSMFGGDGHDDMEGGYGFDTLEGGAGNDLLDGGVLSDVLDGGEGDDTIFGGNGGDTIVSGEGDDLIRGGNGADVIVLSGGQNTLLWGLADDNIDTVYGFNAWGDELSFIPGFFDDGPASPTNLLHATQVGDDSLLFAYRVDWWDGVTVSWEAIALLKGTYATVINQRIANRDIFAAEINGDLPDLDWDPNVPNNGAQVPFGWTAQESSETSDSRTDLSAYDLAGIVEEDVFLF